MVTATIDLMDAVQVSPTDASWRTTPHRFIDCSLARMLPVGSVNISGSWYARGRGPKVCDNLYYWPTNRHCCTRMKLTQSVPPSIIVNVPMSNRPLPALDVFSCFSICFLPSSIRLYTNLSVFVKQPFETITWKRTNISAICGSRFSMELQ